jgi:hypothetical protein
MVQVAASIAHAASTAFPPLLKMVAPAVAASGLPVMAIQSLPCNGGFCVCCACVVANPSWMSVSDTTIDFLNNIIQSVYDECFYSCYCSL